MGLDNLQDAKSSDICSKFPLKPIEDDRSYRAAIEILDRLFSLDDPMTPAELEYFQMLANLAYEYERSLDEKKERL
jgi:antitoxin component HigA of HigAB toxin-antitoxin module